MPDRDTSGGGGSPAEMARNRGVCDCCPARGCDGGEKRSRSFGNLLEGERGEGYSAVGVDFTEIELLAVGRHGNPVIDVSIGLSGFLGAYDFG